MLISGGGTEVKIWNTLSNGQLITKLGDFVKTVTALHVFQPRGTAGLLPNQPAMTVHLVTGCLDGNLRVQPPDTLLDVTHRPQYQEWPEYFPAHT